MALTLPNGSSLAVAATYGDAKAITAITNATEAVATLEASHGIVVGDIFVVSSGWADLDGRTVRAKTVDTNNVTLEGINTSDTNRFPAGSGTGSVREVLTTTAVTQILSFETTGGEQEFYEYQFLDAKNRRQIPTVRQPLTINMTLGDDQTLPWFATLKAASDSGQPRAMFLVLPSAARILYNGYVSLNETPVTTVNEAMALQLSYALVSDPTRYAS
jgi:hypothetical protein